MKAKNSIQLKETNLPERHGYNTVLRNKQFMCLWIAQIFSQLADRAVFVLFVAVLTTEHAQIAQDGGAALLTSWLYVAFTIPAVLLSPLAGVYVDRWSNKVILFGSNVLRAIFVSMIGLKMFSQSLYANFVLAFLISIGSQFFGPAETAAIPRLVKREELYYANSLFFTTMMIALGFGFAAGEPIISQVGVKNAHWAVAGFFVIAAVLLLGISDNKPCPESRKDPWWEDLRFGLAYISGNSEIFKAIIKITVLFSMIITLNIIAVGLTQQVLHIPPFQFGYIVAAAGAGMAIGNFLVARYGQKYNEKLLVHSGFTLLGFFMCLLGSIAIIQHWLISELHFANFNWQGMMMSVPLVLSACVGISCAMVAIPTQAALQAAVPEELRGKVFGTQNTCMSAASTIPVILAGVSADNLPGGVSTTLYFLGVPTMISGVYNLFRVARKK